MAEEIVTDESVSQPVSLSVFVDEVRRCLESQMVRLSGGDPDGLAVLEATDIRGLQFRALFIAGLVEGGFPLRVSGDWLYPHEERQRLKNHGLTLEDISPATLLKEEHFFYQAACRATERLYLTRPLMLEDGTDTVESYFVNETRHALEPSEMAKKTIRSDYDGENLGEVSTDTELVISLVRQRERQLQEPRLPGLLASDQIDRCLAWGLEKSFVSSSTLERIDIERLRARGAFGPFDGEVNHRALTEQLSLMFGPDHAFSASELNLYGNCPFKFFAIRVLRLEPRVEAALDLQRREAGLLLHEVLRRFFESRRARPLSMWELADLRHELGEAAKEVFLEHQGRVPPLNSRVWEIEKQMLKLALEQVLTEEWELQENTKESGVLPTYFELAFGMKRNESDPSSIEQMLELHRNEAEGETADTVRLRGQIDRVDVARDGTAIAYDYKYTRGPGLKDMEEGRDLQMGIYLAAMEKLLLPGREIAGGGYYALRSGEGRRNKGLYRASMRRYAQISAKAKSALGDEEWNALRARIEERIWRYIDSIRVGNFRVAPSLGLKTCAPCDFAAVCRYEPYRISKKLSAAE